jgi:hypothetical protein
VAEPLARLCIVVLRRVCQGLFLAENMHVLRTKDHCTVDLCICCCYTADWLFCVVVGCSACAGTSIFGAFFMFLLGVLIKNNYQ